MKKTTLALSIITAFGLWGCVGSSSSDDQPIDQGHSQQQHHINPSQNTDDNNNNGNSENAGSTSGSAGGASGHISGGSAGGQPIADNDSSDDDKTGGNDNNDNDDNDNGSDAIPTVAEAQKKVADLEQQITNSKSVGNTLEAKKSAAEAELKSVKDQIATLEEKQNPTDSEKEQLKELQEKNLPEVQQAADDVQKAVAENAAKTAELNTERKVAEVGVQISEAKYQDYEPKSKIDALKAQQAVIKATALATEKAGEVKALEAKIGQEASTSTNKPATGLQKDLQEAKDALKNASDDKRPELAAAVGAAEKALADARIEKANAEKAQSEADAAKTAAETAKKEAEEADLNRAVVGTSGFDLKTFQNEDSVERTTSDAERTNGSIWTVHLNDGSTLDIVPATITSQGHWLGESSNYYGNIDNKNGILTYPDSAFGYLGDKFFSVGKTTKTADMPKNETYGYVGSALLKSAEGKDLFATVKATADFASHQLNGNFSDFKSYDRAEALKADKNNGYAGEAVKNLTNPVAFKASINGNRFEPLITEGNKDPVKVYGYFYGATNGTDGKPIGNLNKNADEIGGLVEYSKFHGAFGAKHHKTKDKCYNSSYQEGDC